MRLRDVARNNTVVIFVNAIQYCHYERARRILESLISKAKHCKLICFNMERPSFLAGLKIECKLSEDYLSNIDYEKIDKYVMQEVSKDWYLFNDNRYKNITKFRDFHLGKIAENYFQQFLIPRIKNVWVTNKVLEEYSPGKIIVIEDTEELIGIINLFRKTNRLPCSIFKLTPGSHGFLIRFGKTLRGWLVGCLTAILNIITAALLAVDKKSNEKILVDKKIFESHSVFHDKSRFLPTPFDQGFRVRRDLLIKKQLYLPFCFTKKRCLFFNRSLFLNRWKRLKQHKAFRDYFIFQEIPYWDLVSDKLSEFYLELFPRVARNMGIAEKLMRKKKIRAVLLRNDEREFERTVIAAAKKQNIPTLVIQHGIIADDNSVDYIFADAMFIWGSACRDWFKLKDQKQRLFVTGNPRYDVCFNWKPANQQAELFHTLGLDPKKITILFASQVIVKFSAYRTDDENEVLTKRLLDFFKTSPQYQLVIKVHPYEDENIYKRAVKKRKLSNVCIVKHLNIFDLIVYSHLLITKNSTTGLEAMIFDKPVITIELGKRKDQVPYGEKEAAISIHSAEEIADAIRLCLEDTKTKNLLRTNRLRFVDSYAYKIDGLASQRVVDKIDEILAKGLGNASD